MSRKASRARARARSRRLRAAACEIPSVAASSSAALAVDDGVDDQVGVPPDRALAASGVGPRRPRRPTDRSGSPNSDAAAVCPPAARRSPPASPSADRAASARSRIRASTTSRSVFSTSVAARHATRSRLIRCTCAVKWSMISISRSCACGREQQAALPEDRVEARPQPQQEQRLRDPPARSLCSPPRRGSAGSDLLSPRPLALARQECRHRQPALERLERRAPRLESPRMTEPPRALRSIA